MFDIEGGIPCYEHIACEEACEHWESNPACYEERLQRLVYLAREAAEGYAEAAECLCAIERAGYACAHGSQVYADDAAEIIEELEKLGGSQDV